MLRRRPVRRVLSLADESVGSTPDPTNGVRQIVEDPPHAIRAVRARWGPVSSGDQEIFSTIALALSATEESSSAEPAFFAAAAWPSLDTAYSR